MVYHHDLCYINYRLQLHIPLASSSVNYLLKLPPNDWLITFLLAQGPSLSRLVILSRSFSQTTLILTALCDPVDFYCSAKSHLSYWAILTHMKASTFKSFAQYSTFHY